MSRGITSRKDAVAALRMRLLSCLSEADHWSGSFDESDGFVAKMTEASIALQTAIARVAEAEGLMKDE